MIDETEQPPVQKTDQLIDRFCLADDLRTYDPFDVWKTPLGFRVKDLRNRNPRLGFIPAGILTVLDGTINNKLRLFYRRQEYPIVRAWAALILLNTYKRRRDHILLDFAKRHLEWLVRNSCSGFSGPCWGLGFRYAVDSGLIYDTNTPLSTMTPYALEAFTLYSNLTGDEAFVGVMPGIYRFFDQDIRIIEETDDYVVTSYAPMRDRRVVNAVSYALYSYSILLPFVESSKSAMIEARMLKLYEFVRRSQHPDGSWRYSPDGRSFIDCFHSCIIIKNLFKTEQARELPGCREVIEKGYRYVKQNFFVREDQLFKRFTVTYTPALVRYDLYDNAEMLNLAKLMGDIDLANLLTASIDRSFVRSYDIFSQIDRFGVCRNKNMLRWAVLPYLFALSWDPE